MHRVAPSDIQLYEAAMDKAIGIGKYLAAAMAHFVESARWIQEEEWIKAAPKQPELVITSHSFGESNGAL
eukprot:7146499-Lingulodinium_polyedra.AAC.1